ncbi:MAG TPA: helix-turn-helix transcriptional regulator, partial [Acidothermaceae bacterium]|nr:helix-turn-helix transcriptional regulator [Acidothermaceae bacterium]
KSLFTREYRIFTELLRDTRRRVGLTQVQLAERSGERQSYISKWERGELRLDIVQLRRLCRGMGVGLAEFAAEFEAKAAARKR